MSKKSLSTAASFLLTLSAFFVISLPASASFSDVPTSSPEYEAINALQEQGVIKGFADGTFKSKDFIKRAELLKMIFTHIGYKPSEESYRSKLTDVPNDSWFAPYVNKAIELGVISFSDAVPLFFPEQPITKIEALKVIMPLEGVPAPFINDTTPLIFEDVSPTAPYAYLVRAAQKAKLYTSNNTKSFNPFKNLTRGEAAVLLYRAEIYRESQGNGTSVPSDLNPDDQHDRSEIDLIDDPKFPLLVDVWNKINNQYIDKKNINTSELIYGALEGMVNKLNDPYSTFVPPQQASDFEDTLQGTYEGIGTIIDVFENEFIVVSTLKDSPAEKAGLKAGDIIKKIDGAATSGMAVDEVIDKIKGPAGTEVTLTISRDGQTQTFTITRQSLKLDTVIIEEKESPVTIPADIGYIAIYQFTDSTGEEFSQVLKDILAQKPKGVILDLRNNPGGYLDASYDVMNHIIPNDKIIVYIKVADSTVKYESKGPGELSKLPLVVLVNDGTASAAEVVAGAIQDNDIGELIGEKTYGKGTVQEITTYTDGSFFKLSIAHWLTPLKHDINGIGLTPDIIVNPTKDDKLGNTDTQLEKAISELQSEF